MAFCSKCGNHLEGNERFCVKCGADLAATPPSAAPPAAAASPVSPVAQYATPAGYPPGSMPIAVAVPPQPVPKRAPWGWLAIIVVLLGVAGYWYNQAQHVNPPVPTPSPAPAPGPAPAPNPNPAPNPQSLLQQQVLQMTWQLVSNVVTAQIQWTNNSTMNVASGMAVCTQYDASGNKLSTWNETLTGPINAGTTGNFTNVTLGAPTQGLDKLGCALSTVTPQ